MNRWWSFTLAAYAPHLVEEHLAKMHDDPIIVFAFRPLADMPPRAATYLVFQLMLFATLAAAYLVGLGGACRDAVLAVFALAMIAESHHLVRALVTLRYDAGLVTSLPMPVLGVLVLRALVRRYTVAPAPARL